MQELGCKQLKKSFPGAQGKEGNARKREQDMQSHRESISRIPNVSITSLNVPFILYALP